MYNSNWKKLFGFRNLQEKLENVCVFQWNNDRRLELRTMNFLELCPIFVAPRFFNFQNTKKAIRYIQNQANFVLPSYKLHNPPDLNVHLCISVDQ